jgi:hypothetical protein
MIAFAAALRFEEATRDPGFSVRPRWGLAA